MASVIRNVQLEAERLRDLRVAAAGSERAVAEEGLGREREVRREAPLDPDAAAKRRALSLQRSLRVARRQVAEADAEEAAQKRSRGQRIAEQPVLKIHRDHRIP